MVTKIYTLRCWRDIPTKETIPKKNIRFGPALKTCCIILFTLLLGNNTSAQSVEPVLVEGNPSCSDLGYDFGFKPQPEPPPTGNYAFPDGINVLSISSNGTYFDWSSTLGLDAVIVKGGTNANSYIYAPPAESFGDHGLHSPINPNNNQPYAISHIEVCYDYEVDVSKTATTTFTRTYKWDIDKSVSPASWDLFTGDEGTSKYTVIVDKKGWVDGDWAVEGYITIENNTPYDATIESVLDVVYPDVIGATIEGVSFPYTLASGAKLTIPYSAALPDNMSRTNYASVTTSGIVGGAVASADFIFGEPTTKVNDEINVTDSNGPSWGPVSDDASFFYEKTFTCDDEGTNDNTATITETGQSDDASVTVNCHALEVTKTANTSFDRTWKWTIVKTGDQTELILAPGQSFLVNYEVTVDATYTDDNYAVYGEITISNPAPLDALITELIDVVSPDIAANVDCGVTFPTTLAAGGSLTCTYSADVPDAYDRTNTATTTMQNYSYASDGTSTPIGTTDYDGTATIDFNVADITEIDACIDVDDTNIGDFGTVCAGEAPAIFSYGIYVGPYTAPDQCGDNYVNNTATFVTYDTGTEGSDDHTVHIIVPCDFGCTLTQGYWKTHSKYGPAPYDDNWAKIGEDTPFFLSGQSYYEVLWTPPAGNVYYILAHQYIAAELNMLNGASSPSDVVDAFDEAQNLFNNNTPDEADALKGRNKKLFTDLAMILDDYNNGLIGPGHCSEEAEPEPEISNYTKGAAVQQSLGPEIDDIILEAYPNPFSDELNFHIVLPYESKMVLEIFNLVGQKIAVLHDNEVEAGQVIDVRVNASELPKQTLIYRMSTSEEVLTGKLLPIQR